ncbi:hypothetical protein G6F56_003746 [Rhizopus delemar]|uniref:Uncharacterized protein n=1 Tax=Rhizopus stolonifer TaxID=4846 RepID=A0A367JIP8_RHIST|nr:hypothetical protein G6F56_003746 [Rhizopus delemar]RCH89842.1 hypothetical protein CU098_005189 [Rhizopus stolonifer]
MTLQHSNELSGKSNTSSSSDNDQKVHIRIVPNIDNPSRSLIFSIIEKDLEPGKVIKVGRFTDKSCQEDHISFKSKVVSRSHCEIWLSYDGKVQLKDTKSSSGTFVNHLRLSSANQESQTTEIKNGDLIQLGVDYQGGFEEIYRSVKMKLEINRPSQEKQLSYSISAFNNLRSMTSHHLSDTEVEECCICLYALAPFQALFAAPCSHTYHFKCIRPLFDSYPGFQCPVCRTYSDLDASVTVETEEVIEKYGFRKSAHAQDDPCCEETEEILHPLPVHVISNELPLSTTLVVCPNILSENLDSSTSDLEVIPVAENHCRISSNTSTSTVQRQKASKYNSNLVEKIRMAFSNEKRKSTFGKRRANSGRTSGSNSGDEMDRSETYFNVPSQANLSHTLSRQSTHNHTNGIVSHTSR